ncbi:hypothetical protein [Actinosynnema sp. NPDC020468]|uniref:hypothetical protein n=1 Tax=Actinosynnema sp. NPDC020468 TaxID=3154488 RepID=UPI0033D1D0B5
MRVDSEARPAALKALVSAMKRAGGRGAEDAKKILGKAIINFRTTFPRDDGSPDVTGRTFAYRTEFANARRLAGMDSQDHDALFVTVRHYSSDAARDHLRAEAGGDDVRYRELCHTYGMRPESNNKRRGAQLATVRAMSSELRVGPQSLLALMTATRDRLRADVDAEAAGEYVPQTAMTPDDAASLAAVADDLARTLPAAVALWRKHFPRAEG